MTTCYAKNKCSLISAIRFFENDGTNVLKMNRTDNIPGSVKDTDYFIFIYNVTSTS